VVKYPALLEKSNQVKKAFHALVYPINLLIGWTGLLFFLPHLTKDGEEDKTDVIKSQLLREKTQRKSDIKTLSKVFQFVKELRSLRLAKHLTKAFEGQNVFLKKSHPHVVAK
jgi:hypothetical protein